MLLQHTAPYSLRLLMNGPPLVPHSLSQDTKTGGSNGATMRFAPEANHGANAGLLAARNFLEPIKKQFQWSVR